MLSLNGAKNNPKIVTKITAVRPRGGGSHKTPPPKYATDSGYRQCSYEPGVSCSQTVSLYRTVSWVFEQINYDKMMMISCMDSTLVSQTLRYFTKMKNNEKIMKRIMKKFYSRCPLGTFVQTTICPEHLSHPINSCIGLCRKQTRSYNFIICHRQQRQQ